MYALSEKEDVHGSWIVYECCDENCKFRMKVFEDKTSNIGFAPVGTGKYLKNCIESLLKESQNDGQA